MTLSSAVLPLLLFCPILLSAESPILIARQQTEQTRTVSQNPIPETVSLLKEECSNGSWKTALSFLYWQASEDGLEFAAENQPRFPLSPNIPTDISANLLNLDFSWQPAFKALFGYHFANADWDLTARWTYFHSKSHRSAYSPLSSARAGLLPLWVASQSAFSIFPVYNYAKAALLLHCNTIDLELAYTGGLSRHLYLKLHTGLKAVMIDQTLRAAYKDGFSSGAEQLISSHAKAESNCHGIGPRIGLGSKWMLPKGCSLIAETAAAFALSQIKTKREDNSVGSVSGNIQNLSAEIHESFWVWRPLLEVKMGFLWSVCFGQKTSLSLEASYEIQHYWEQNMMTRYADQATFYSTFNARSNLILQGLSLTASLGY